MAMNRFTPALASMLLALTVVAGARLAWGASPLVVLDSNDHQVGLFYFQGVEGAASEAAIHKINGVSYALPITRNEFVSTGFTFYYTTTDCSGTQFLAALPAPLFVVPVDGTYAGIFEQTLYFEKGPPQQLGIQSLASPTDPTKPVPSAQCVTCSSGCGTMAVEPLGNLCTS